MRRKLLSRTTIALVDRSLFVFDERGEPLNTLEAVETLLAQKPYLQGSAARFEQGRQLQVKRGALSERFAGSTQRMSERVLLGDVRNPLRVPRRAG